ncbi:MAG: hypothetical protein GY827_10900 [Cytophagales bacterium]|nr:hypothetical protein [Cytophagales bacterium]
MSETYKKYLVLAIAILFLVVYHIISFQGYYGYDDLDYVQFAQKMIDGNFHFTKETFSARIVPVSLLALSFLCFGINDFSTTLPSILITISSLIILFYWVKEKKVEQIIFVLFFFVTDFYTLSFGGKVYPDVFVTFSALGIAWVMFQSKQSAFARSFCVILFLWVGILSKLTILFVGFPMLFFLISDICQKKNVQFWMTLTSLVFITTTIYLGIYFYLTGNALYRFHNISSNYYSTVCSYYELPKEVLIARLTYQPIFMFIGSGMIMAIMGGVASFFSSIKKPITTFFLIYLLTYYFMSTSYRYYLPMCTVEARHFLPLIPSASLLMGGYLITSTKWRTLLIINSLILLVIFIWINTPLIWVHVLLQTVLLLRQINVLKAKKYFVWGIVGVLLLHPVYSAYKHRNVEYTNIKQLVDPNFKGRKILIP